MLVVCIFIMCGRLQHWLSLDRPWLSLANKLYTAIIRPHFLHLQSGNLILSWISVYWQFYRDMQPDKHFPLKHLASLGTDTLKFQHLATDLVKAHKIPHHLPNNIFGHLFKLNTFTNHRHAYKTGKKKKTTTSRTFRSRFIKAWNTPSVLVMNYQDAASFNPSMLPDVSFHPFPLIVLSSLLLCFVPSTLLALIVVFL